MGGGTKKTTNIVHSKKVLEGETGVNNNNSSNNSNKNSAEEGIFDLEDEEEKSERKDKGCLLLLLLTIKAKIRIWKKRRKKSKMTDLDNNKIEISIPVADDISVDESEGDVSIDISLDILHNDSVDSEVDEEEKRDVMADLKQRYSHISMSDLSDSMIYNIGDDESNDLAAINSSVGLGKAGGDLSGVSKSVTFSSSTSNFCNSISSICSNNMLTPWEEGMDCINSLLEEGSPTMNVMTQKQRDGLKKVKEMLLSQTQVNDGYFVGGGLGVSSSYPSARTSHVPRALLKTTDTSRTSAFLLSEYAGYTQRPVVLPHHKLSAIVKAHLIAKKISKKFRKVASSNDVISNIPSYWKSLTKQEKLRLKDLLSWENISDWSKFNVFDVNETLHGKHTLTFVAWAILASPSSQHALDLACQIQCSDNSSTSSLSSTGDVGSNDGDIKKLEEREGYNFISKLDIKERTLVKFIQAIEHRYVAENPYHNEIHAADITQSLHCLLQMGGIELAEEKWEAFSVLLAAVGHDVGHPGMNNNFHVNSRSNFALTYNDDSVLENHHASTIFRLIEGEHRQEELDVLETFQDEKSMKVRQFIIQVILSTDMTKHFKKNNFIKGTMGRTSKCKENDNDDSSHFNTESKQKRRSIDPFLKDEVLRHELLSFLCHVADISNPSKPNGVMRKWTDRVMEEFYCQGDKENELGLPFSPCCDRNGQTIEEVQIGFINFIVLPTFKLCGELFPDVTTKIIPQIETNLLYWKKIKKEKQQQKQQEQQLKQQEQEMKQKELHKIEEDTTDIETTKARIPTSPRTALKKSIVSRDSASQTCSSSLRSHSPSPKTSRRNFSASRGFSSSTSSTSSMLSMTVSTHEADVSKYDEPTLRKNLNKVNRLLLRNEKYNSNNDNNDSNRSLPSTQMSPEEVEKLKKKQIQYNKALASLDVIESGDENSDDTFG